MVKLRVPATSANVGPGFDCLGIAWNIYNTFDVELSDKDELTGVKAKYNNPDNLFLQAYHAGCEAAGIHDFIKADFRTGIPVSRGLGSSAALIVGGLLSASLLHDNCLSKEEIFALAAKMEGHPDNVAPAVFGGMTACTKTSDGFCHTSLPLHEDWCFTAFIPDFEVSTEQARNILPCSYPRETAVNNGAKGILLCDALRTGNMELLAAAATDEIHEPYRKTLIPGFDELKEIVTKDSGGVLLISGSGSTCLSIAKHRLSADAAIKIHNMKWEIKDVRPDFQGGVLCPAAL